jgi:hypothetical protein
MASVPEIDAMYMLSTQMHHKLKFSAGCRVEYPYEIPSGKTFASEGRHLVGRKNSWGPRPVCIALWWER